MLKPKDYPDHDFFQRPNIDLKLFNELQKCVLFVSSLYNNYDMIYYEFGFSI